MNIGQFISQYLEKNHISQRQFAIKCNMSNGYISMLINNSNPKTNKPIMPSLSALLAISQAMGITLDDLIRQIDDLNVNISSAKNLSTKYINKTKEYIELFEKLTQEEQNLIISQIKGILNNR